MPAGTLDPPREEFAHANAQAGQQVGRKTPGLPCAMVGRLMPCSPGSRTFLWPPSPRELTMPSTRLGSRTSPQTGLTVATTARTTRFCRTHGPPFRRSFPGPVDEAGNLQTRRSLTAPFVRAMPRTHGEQSALPFAVRARRCCVHRKPGSAIITTRDRPSRVSRDARHIRHFRISINRNIFGRWD